MNITVDGYPAETLKYVPKQMSVLNGKGLVLSPVTGVISYPPGQHPGNCPIRKDLIAVEIKTVYGRAWHGTQTAYINSHLRFVVGVNPRDEVRAKWEAADID